MQEGRVVSKEGLCSVKSLLRYLVGQSVIHLFSLLFTEARKGAYVITSVT
jgi:hypothetical protein